MRPVHSETRCPKDSQGQLSRCLPASAGHGKDDSLCFGWRTLQTRTLLHGPLAIEFPLQREHRKGEHQLGQFKNLGHSFKSPVLLTSVSNVKRAPSSNALQSKPRQGLFPLQSSSSQRQHMSRCWAAGSLRRYEQAFQENAFTLKPAQSLQKVFLDDIQRKVTSSITRQDFPGYPRPALFPAPSSTSH